VLDGDEIPWVTKKLAGKGCSGWRMAGTVFLTVTRGGGSRLCHGNDIPVYRDRRGSMGGRVQEFLRGVVVLLE
jgi:hypothetical protein